MSTTGPAVRFERGEVVVNCFEDGRDEMVVEVDGGRVGRRGGIWNAYARELKIDDCLCFILWRIDERLVC